MFTPLPLLDSTARCVPGKAAEVLGIAGDSEAGCCKLFCGMVSDECCFFQSLCKYYLQCSASSSSSLLLALCLFIFFLVQTCAYIKSSRRTYRVVRNAILICCHPPLLLAPGSYMQISFLGSSREIFCRRREIVGSNREIKCSPRPGKPWGCAAQ